MKVQVIDMELRRTVLSTRRRMLLGVFLVAWVLITSVYAVVAAATEGLGSAVGPILISISASFNCLLFFTGNAFPPRS